MSNFYNNIKTLYNEQYLDDVKLVNALIRNFITEDEFIEIKGEESLDGLKQAKIAKSKTDLEDYLASYPYTTDDGKQYSVTSQKQTLLANEIASYQLAQAAKVPYQLSWNTTGDECTNFTIEEITALALAINAYVKPLISYQQAKEVEIRNVSTKEALDAIVVDYDSVAK